MIDPRWSKVLKDLWQNKARSFLVILTIAVGVFSVGYVSSTFEKLMSDMDTDYQSVDPHGAIIFTDPFDDDLLYTLNKVSGVGRVEGRATASAETIGAGGKKLPVAIYGIPALADMQIDRLRPVALPAGNSPASLSLGEHEILLDNTVQPVLGLMPGDRINLTLADGTVRTLRIAAFVRDVTNAPFVFSNQVLGYTDLQTLAWLGGGSQFNTVYLTVSSDQKNEEHVRQVSAAVADKIQRSGRTVYFNLVYQPGRHYATDITSSLGVMMGFLGAMSVFLSAFLVVNTINALLGQQVRQIGMMKSIGATTVQLIGMYLVLVLVFGGLSLLISIPLSALCADFTVSGIARYLNFQRQPFMWSMTSILLQVAVALVVPLLAALAPVLKGTRITIREAISSYGLGRGTFGRGLLDRLVEAVRFLPRPLLISLRNTFRRKARLFLTLSSLTLAGAIFIGVFNLRASMDAAIQSALGYLLSDVNISFRQAYRIEKIKPLAMSVPGVVAVEGWGSTLAEVLSPDETSSTQVGIFAPPADSQLIDPTLTSGRWLEPEDENALVIGNHLLAVRPDLKTGDEVTLTIDNQKSTWRIVGTYQMAGNVIPPRIYANGEYLAKLMGQVSRVGEVRIATTQHDLQSQQRIANQLEAVFSQAGIQVSQTQLGAVIQAANKQLTDILVYFLLTMAVLIAVVGGLGLMSTMSINVIERTRELGVMRAIGAANGDILQIVIVEGMFIGTISWALGALLAIPIGYLLDYVVGIAFLKSPLGFTFSMDGFVVWLVGVLILSSLASFIPARHAAGLTVREVLAYE